MNQKSIGNICVNYQSQIANHAMSVSSNQRNGNMTNATNAKTPKMHEKVLINPKTASQMLGIHINTLRQWAVSGFIPELRTPKGHRRYRRIDVENLIAKMEGKTK